MDWRLGQLDRQSIKLEFLTLFSDGSADILRFLKYNFELVKIKIKSMRPPKRKRAGTLNMFVFLLGLTR